MLPECWVYTDATGSQKSWALSPLVLVALYSSCCAVHFCLTRGETLDRPDSRTFYLQKRGENSQELLSWEKEFRTSEMINSINGSWVHLNWHFSTVPIFNQLKTAIDLSKAIKQHKARTGGKVLGLSSAVLPWGACFQGVIPQKQKIYKQENIHYPNWIKATKNSQRGQICRKQLWNYLANYKTLVCGVLFSH